MFGLFSWLTGLSSWHDDASAGGANHEPMATKETIVAVLKGPQGVRRVHAEQKVTRPSPEAPPAPPASQDPSWNR